MNYCSIARGNTSLATASIWFHRGSQSHKHGKPTNCEEKLLLELKMNTRHLTAKNCYKILICLPRSYVWSEENCIFATSCLAPQVSKGLYKFLGTVRCGVFQFPWTITWILLNFSSQLPKAPSWVSASLLARRTSPSHQPAWYKPPGPAIKPENGEDASPPGLAKPSPSSQQPCCHLALFSLLG